MSDWIHIGTNALAKHASNAALLCKVWDGMNVPESCAAWGGAGKTAEQLRFCEEESNEIHKAMSKLLNNTVSWCKTVKVNFETTDNA